jgi:hypothetical protein
MGTILTILDHTPAWGPYALAAILALTGFPLWFSHKLRYNILAVLCFGFAVVLCMGLDFYIRMLPRP